MLLLRAHVLALGYSGVRVEVVERMVEMLNRDVIPAVPEQGSLGASGDLAPLACLALPLIGRGRILTTDGAEPAERCAAPRGARAARAPGEGGARARQRHAGHARDRHPGAGARRTAAPRGRCDRGDDDRGVARHRRAVRRASARAASPSRADRVGRQPAAAAPGLAHPGIAPRLAASRPGRVLAALHAAGARRLARHGPPRRVRARDRGQRRLGQPDRARGARRRGRRGPHGRQLPRDAGRGGAGRAGPVARVGGLDQRSHGSTGSSMPSNPTGCRRSSCPRAG